MDFPKNWRTGWHEDGNSAYAVNADKVVIYDNPMSFVRKVEYIAKMRLAGAMIWSIDTDDFRGDCATLHTDFFDPLTPKDYPLMRVINSALARTSGDIDDNKIGSQPSSADTIRLAALTTFLTLSLYV